MTALAPAAYLASFESDAARLAQLAAGEGALQRPVPSCPGWTLGDLVWHVLGVYAHKAATLRLGRRPAAGEWEPADPPDAELVHRCREQVAELVVQLRAVGPDGAAWTWVPGQGSGAFWFRRMAHEAYVHRVDGELAVGVPVGPAAAGLGADGALEVLDWFGGRAHEVDAARSDAGAAC